MQHLNQVVQRHPLLWSWLLIAFIALPFSPLISGISFVGILGFTGKQYLRQWLHHPWHQGFALVSLGMILTSVVALHPTDAFIGLINFLPFFGLFASLCTLIQHPKQLQQLSWTLVLTSIPSVLIGLGQQFLGWSGHPYLWGRIINLQIPAGGRMSSIFVNPNVFANYLIIIFCLGLGLWVITHPQEPRSSNSEPEWFIKIRWGGLTVLLFAIAFCLISTGSRNAWGCLAWGCLAFGVYQGWRWLIGVLGLLILGISGAAFTPSPLNLWFRTLVPPMLWTRFSSETYINHPFAELRTTIWQTAWSLTQQHPWTGWGLRNFPSLYEAQMSHYVGHPHNLFLMLSSETGLVTTLLFFGLVGWILVEGVLFLRWRLQTPKLWKEQAIFFSYLVAFLGSTLFHLVDITLFDMRVNSLGWLLLGAIGGIVTHHQGVRSSRTLVKIVLNFLFFVEKRNSNF